MRYRLSRPGSPSPTLAVFVLPVSGDRLDYRILSPRVRKSKLVRQLAAGKLEVRLFPGVTGEAVERVAEGLEREVRAQKKGREGLSGSLVTGGVAVAVLGVVNWFIPDPLPAVDEVLLMVGGALMVVWGRRRKSRDILVQASLSDSALAAIQALPRKEDPILARAFGSLQAMEGPDADPHAADAIEREARWLVEFVDVEAAVGSGDITVEEVRELFKILGRFIPFRRLERLESRGASTRARRRRILRRIRDRHGFAENAVTVYGEFYRSARRALEDWGR